MAFIAFMGLMPFMVFLMLVLVLLGILLWAAMAGGGKWQSLDVGWPNGNRAQWLAAACKTNMALKPATCTWTDMKNTWIMSTQHGQLNVQGCASKDLV